MTIQLEVEGVQYERFESASIDISLDVLARSFTFTATSSTSQLLPFKGGEKCRVIVSGIPVLTGHIESVVISYDSGSHTINVSGRDNTGDLIDSTLDALEINPPISLKKVIERVLKQIGLDISVIDNTDIDDFNEAEDKLGPSVGQNAFEFIEILARKRQVLLTSNAKGDVVITRSEPKLLSGASVVMREDGIENNVIGSSASFGSLDLYRDYVVKSQQNASPLSLTGDVDLAALVDQGGGAIDSAVRVGRQLIIKAEKASSAKQNRERALWEANIHRTRSRIYSAEVQGHTFNEAELWEVNRLVEVQDEYADISARMLLNTIHFSVDRLLGNTSTLGFVVKDAYQVALEEPEETDNVGGGILSL